MSPRRFLAILASVVTVVSLAGCGGNDHKSASADSTSTSSTSPVTPGAQDPDTPTSEPSGTATAAGAGDVLTKENFASTMRAAILAKHTAHITMRFGSDLAAQGDVSYTDGGTSMRLTMKRSGMSTDLRFVDDKFYLSVPGMTPTGKFVAVAGDDKTMGPLVSELQNFGPQGSIGIISKGLQKITYVGKDSIDDAPVDHYRVTVDSSAVIEGMGGPGESTGTKAKTVRYDLYVDQDQLMRRAVFNLLGQRMRLDVSDWGTPVHITAPSTADIVKVPTG